MSFSHVSAAEVGMKTIQVYSISFQKKMKPRCQIGYILDIDGLRHIIYYLEFYIESYYPETWVCVGFV